MSDDTKYSQFLFSFSPTLFQIKRVSVCLGSAVNELDLTNVARSKQITLETKKKKKYFHL